MGLKGFFWKFPKGIRRAN